MKRCILPTLFFYLVAFSVHPARALPPLALALIPAAQVAAKVAPFVAAGVGGASVAAGINYYYSDPASPVYVDRALNSVASSADYVFSPGFAAIGPMSIVTSASYPNVLNHYVGGRTAIGSKLSDIYTTLKNSASNQYTDLKTWLSQYTAPGGIPGAGLPASFAGQTFTMTDGSNVTLTYAGWATGMDPSYMENQYATKTYKFKLTPVGGCYATGSSPSGSWECFNGTSWQGTWMGTVWGMNGSATSNPATIPASEDTVNDSQVKQNFPGAPIGVKTDIKDAVAAQNPPVTSAGAVPDTGEQIKPVAGITPQELAQILAQNTADVAKKVADAAAQIAAANPSDAAAQIAAQQAALEAAKAAAQASQATQDATKPEAPPAETFGGINSNPFAQPYNPGQFDVAARLDQFFDSVKSSGLFSFSSGFFNSLPGGGSPIFTINGGQTFGTHTIDFSQTMTTGLAVLKSILLACFGFLSIRAVIMKR